MPESAAATVATYCVFGNPIEHSLSPQIHTQFAQLTGQDMVYDKRLAPEGNFAPTALDFFAQGGLGCNITVPFKLDAELLADATSERVQLAGACNTLVKRDDGTLFGDNTDGLGLMADITQGAGFDIAGQRVLLIGAGGAGAGVLGPLLAQRPAEVVVANRSNAKSDALVGRHKAVAERQGVQLTASGLHDDRLLRPFDLVLNASASSLAGQASPVSHQVLGPHTLAVDLMYGPAAQAFMAWATAHGAQARDGLGMLVEQAAEAFALWRGVRPPTAPVLQALRQRLADKR